MELYLEDIVWGNRLYVNAQFTVTFVSLLQKYAQGKIPLAYFFSYAHAIKMQRKIILYKDLARQIDEITTLEDLIKTGKVTLRDVRVIHYIINRVYIQLTGAPLDFVRTSNDTLS